MDKELNTGTEEDFKKISYNYVYRMTDTFWVNGMLGKLLTLIDASVENERQCKSLKDMVRQIVHSQNDRFHSYMFGIANGEFEEDHDQVSEVKK